MKEKEIAEEVELPEGVDITIENKVVKAKGSKGECMKELNDPKIIIEKADGKVIVKAKNATKKQKTLVGTYASHVKNLVKGASEGYVYKLKVCSGHFPMTVNISGNDVSVNNFLGEKFPRKIRIKEGVSVKIEGDIITVESTSKELAGQAAADIERLTRITDRDRRIFQDGIFITEKAGNPVR